MSWKTTETGRRDTPALRPDRPSSIRSRRATEATCENAITEGMPASRPTSDLAASEAGYVDQRPLWRRSWSSSERGREPSGPRSPEKAPGPVLAGQLETPAMEASPRDRLPLDRATATPPDRAPSLAEVTITGEPPEDARRTRQAGLHGPACSRRTENGAFREEKRFKNT